MLTDGVSRPGMGGRRGKFYFGCMVHIEDFFRLSLKNTFQVIYKSSPGKICLSLVSMLNVTIKQLSHLCVKLSHGPSFCSQICENHFVFSQKFTSFVSLHGVA